MQLKGLHKSIYTLANYSLRQEQAKKTKEHPYYEVVKAWNQLKKEGVSLKTLEEIIGISRATYYRYQKAVQSGKALASRRPKRFRQSQIPKRSQDVILEIRKANPTYGKQKITVILKRDYDIHLSESSVGRELSRLLQAGKISRSLSAPKQKRQRRFKQHAKPWVYGSRAKRPGELVQIDHMSVSKNQRSFKHFQAWDPLTKTLHAEIHGEASSCCARKFLLGLIQALPFKLYSVQVDGGSEFMLEFEAACAELGIALFVIPPRRPQYNGGVERGNRIFREEFYARSDLLADSMAHLRLELDLAVKKYNTFRPHASLQGLTPFAYTHHLLQNHLLSQIV